MLQIIYSEEMMIKINNLTKKYKEQAQEDAVTKVKRLIRNDLKQ